jgi:hypothetical protein
MQSPQNLESFFALYIVWLSLQPLILGHIRTLPTLGVFPIDGLMQQRRERDNIIGVLQLLRRDFSERSPDGAERNPGWHRPLAAIPDYAQLHPGYAFERSCKNRILANLCSGDRFSLSVASCVGAVAIRFSRQQGRRFNDLQGVCVPNSATAFDNRRRIGLKRKILLT